MSTKTYLIILKTGIYLSFLSVFFVFSSLLFPYITSKQLCFNILIEILAIFWLAFIIKYPQARPKKSLISLGLVFFFSAILISSVFGVDFNLSFWGDVERMLGLFHLLHFFVFYLIIITVFRTAKDWHNLFIASIAAAVMVCFYSIFEVAHSTIGNTAYVSGYAIFNIFFALILFFKRYEKKSKRIGWIISALYLVAAFIMLLVMKETHTRGAYVGLGISFILFFILYSFYSSSKKIKIYSLTAIAIGIIAIVMTFSFSQSNFVKNNSVLSRITQISSNTVTFQTRLISWKTAIKDFHNHPVLGTGYGNFAITFDKYFDPKFYNHTTSETYFDRAHNNLVDITSTAGLLGLLSYLSIFVAVFYYLFKNKKQNKISSNEFILLICLFVAYFIQNLAVFDSLVTYISLMIALGYIYWLNNQNEEELEISNSLTNKELAVLFVAGLIFLSIIYQYNIRVWKMLNNTIDSQRAFAQGDVESGLTIYQKALSYKTVLDRDSRSSLINFLSANPTALSKLKTDRAKEVLDFVIKQAEENVKYNQADSMAQLQLAQILNVASVFYIDQKDKFNYFSDQALKAIDKSIASSPGRITIYPTKAQIYINRNEKDKTIEILKYAINLNKEYNKSYCDLSKILLYYKDNNEGFAMADKCLDYNGVDSFAFSSILDILLNHYLTIKDWQRAVVLYQKYSQLEPKNAQIFVSLARTYKELGDKDNATITARKAVEIDPSLKFGAEEFIKGL
ncbi:O-antigen ligase family protein [Patescibacteria group bacterium]|nr:O-antigen ligase family protein [Patescibacteria group bacterium]MBU1870792.1 O-antigen ligase family protein [Patescibacteria group bacterium]